MDVLQHLFGPVHGHRIVGLDPGPVLLQGFDDLDGRGEAHVVGIGLKGQPQDADGLARDVPHRLFDLFDEVHLLLVVDPLDLLEQFEIVAQFFRDPDESLEVLGKTETPEAYAGV